MTLSRVFGPLSVALLSISVPAFAYIPPAQFIIKNMASKRSGIRSVRVASVVKDSGNRHFKVLTIYDSATRTMRSEAFGETGLVLYEVEKKDGDLPLSLMVLYDPDDAEIVGALKRSSIPIRSTEQDGDDVVSLQRWNGSIAWALGLAAVPAERKAGQKDDASQLWIEKDSFLPVRLIVGDQDLQFTHYRYSQELPYPRTTTLSTRAGAAQVEEDIQSFRINPQAAEIRAMQVSGTAAAGGFTSAGDASPLKDLIRAYYAGIR